ncbi:MAG: class I SAM-dependent RNA methyltransferase [Deltaproteobacteria bacterium]|nr:class I SAM-dependent RNA methyltransferase [Deltaproteobacteria bacterium]
MPQLTIEGLVHGGETLARLDGRVVFVRGGAPGDVVLAELTGDEKTFLRARVTSVVRAGPDRVEPPCPIVASCGGCPAQQVGYVAQVREKERLLDDALVRVGGVQLASVERRPMLRSPSEFRYRRRARLHRGPQGTWGFSGAIDDEERAHAIVPVSTCLLFEPALQTLHERVQEALASLGALPEVTDLGLDVSSAGAGAIELHTRDTPTPGLRKKAEALLKLKGVKGIVLGPTGAPQLLGQPVLTDAPHEGQKARLRSRPDLFAQANRAGVPLLQRELVSALGTFAQGRVLELFCGAGTLTLPLLEAGARVLGAESVGPSLQLLRTSADEAGLSSKLRIVAGDASAISKQLVVEQERFEAIVLDPPRTGAAEVVRLLPALSPKRVVYVSCEPTTLARDAKLLQERGFSLVSARGLDLFPQTAHQEVVAVFEPRG